MTLSGVAERRKNSPDRVFKWVAALAGLCLVGFVVFVILRGSPRPAGSGSSALESPPPPVLKAGTVAPGFTLPGLHGGNPVSLSAFRGRPVIVNFFASWCPDCRAELGAVATIARRTTGRVAVIGVDSNETSDATATSLLAAAGATYPVAVDAQAKVASRYLVQALPVSYFLSASGKVVGAALGPQSVASLQRWVARLGAAG
ncbi:MAG: TlpA family protein disulfide reductase [Acidimicrobiales bacterium]|jgi:thiol-disulfide isomerase/thioredoxin